MQKNSGLLFIVFLLLAHYSFSQNSDSTKVVSHFGGAVTVTNNGISFIPTFSLGKPAVIFDLSMGRRLSFDPPIPVSISSVINKVIRTDISSSKDFVWNVSLIYSFIKNYVGR